MLNTWTCKLLAGTPLKWDDELRSANIRPGVRVSLSDLQREQHERGRRSAQLLRQNITGGWTVRYISSLDDFALIPGARNGIPTRTEAIEIGSAWANEDPESREFFSHLDELKKYADDGTPLDEASKP